MVQPPEGVDGPATPRVLLAGDRRLVGWEIPWLPDLLGSGLLGHSGDPVREAFGRQVAMLRALAESGPKGCALQLRFVVSQQAVGGRRSRLIRTVLLGAAIDDQSLVALDALVQTTLPPEFPVQPMDTAGLADLVDAADRHPWAVGSMIEIRRAIESGDPELDLLEPGVEPTLPVLLRWEWTRLNLLATLGALRTLPDGGQLIIHIEPRAVSSAALGWLRDEVAAHRQLVRDDASASPLLLAAIAVYRQRLRDLPRACLHLRVLVACPTGVPDGIAEVAGTDLTRAWESGGAIGTFDLVKPTTQHEVDCALMMVQSLRSEPTRLPTPRELGELLFLFDPHEANAAFRIPLPDAEGLPGVRMAPVSRMPRGLGVASAAGARTVHLGRGASDEPVGLTLDEINRHVLVCGLPGFGKTTSVQSILRQLWQPPSGVDRIPFLVIDPAKGDYERLAEALGEECLRVDLGTESLAFNPFGCPPEVPRRMFATRVAAAFDAAFSLSEVYPAAATLLARAIHVAFDRAAVPTLALVYAVVADLIATSAYGAVTRGELRAALQGRLELVADGSMGPALMGDELATIDWAALLARPAVIQLRGFAGPRERSLMVALLLAGLVSYREAHPGEGLTHVTVLEEAHRVVGRGVAQTAAGEGSRVFIDAMAELRGAGEGIIVVEQAPSRLAPEVAKLVGSIVAHRLIDAEERSTVAASMVLDDGASDLARLRTGSAVVFAADMLAPTLVQIEPPDPTHTSAPHQPGFLVVGGAAQRLWCQDCPVACRGRGGYEVARLLDPPPPTTRYDQALARTKGLVSRVEEQYCFVAYAAAQAADGNAAWTEQRRALQKVYRGKPTPPTNTAPVPEARDDE